MGVKEGDLPSDTIRSLHIDMDGYVWVGTDDGATRFNGQRFNDLIMTVNGGVIDTMVLIVILLIFG